MVHEISFDVMTPMWVVGLMSHNPNSELMIESRDQCDRNGHIFYHKYIDAVWDSGISINMHLCTRCAYFWFSLMGKQIDGYLASLDDALTITRCAQMAEGIAAEVNSVSAFYTRTR